MKLRTKWMAALLAVGLAGSAYSETLVIERERPDWGAPFRFAGSVISAPFVALGSALSPSTRYVEPVGERVWITRRSSTMLMPVGERFTTVKRYHKTMLAPVGERFITVKRHHKTMLKPVGERFITVKRYHKTLLAPVGERITTVKIIRSRPVLLEPVGERTFIRTTRVYSQPWLCY